MSTLTVCEQAIRAWKAGCQKLGVELSSTILLPVEAHDGFIPLSAFVEFLERTAGDSGIRVLGWLVGEHYDLRLLGQVGSAMLSSATLGQALRRFVDYFSLVQDATEFDLRMDGENVYLGYRILDPELWPRQQDALFTLSIISQLLRRASGFGWDQLQIQLETDDGVLASELGRRARLSCQGNGEANILRFPRAFLELPLIASDAVVPPDYKQLNRSIAQKRRTMSVGLRVRTAIYRHLGSPEIDQGRIASELGMSTRTLRRKLAEENISFQQIVYGCRMRHAAQQFRLRRTVSIADLAYRLGYSEHSAFTRAFSKWSGMPPHAFLKHGAAG